MAQFLILTASEAIALRGPTLPGKALDPVPLTDGRFVLPLSTRPDDHGEAINAALDALPVAEVPGALFRNEVEE